MALHCILCPLKWVALIPICIGCAVQFSEGVAVLTLWKITKISLSVPKAMKKSYWKKSADCFILSQARFETPAQKYAKSDAIYNTMDINHRLFLDLFIRTAFASERAKSAQIFSGMFAFHGRI